MTISRNRNELDGRASHRSSARNDHFGPWIRVAGFARIVERAAGGGRSRFGDANDTLKPAATRWCVGDRPLLGLRRRRCRVERPCSAGGAAGRSDHVGPADRDRRPVVGPDRQRRPGQQLAGQTPEQRQWRQGPDAVRQPGRGPARQAHHGVGRGRAAGRRRRFHAGPDGDARDGRGCPGRRRVRSGHRVGAFRYGRRQADGGGTGGGRAGEPAGGPHPAGGGVRQGL